MLVKTYSGVEQKVAQERQDALNERRSLSICLTETSAPKLDGLARTKAWVL